jgi:hypothetical protein
MSFGPDSSSKPPRGDFSSTIIRLLVRGVSGNGQTEEGGSRMACITTKHGKTGDPLLRCQQEAPHHKTEGTKEQAQVRLDETLKKGKQSVNTKTTSKTTANGD